MKFIAAILVFFSLSLSADEGLEIDRDPAGSLIPPTKRNYPGGADEEDLRVLSEVPEAVLYTDTRSIQKEVYKALYNQELKDVRQDEPSEE